MDLRGWIIRAVGMVRRHDETASRFGPVAPFGRSVYHGEWRRLGGTWGPAKYELTFTPPLTIPARAEVVGTIPGPPPYGPWAFDVELEIRSLDGHPEGI